MWALEADQGKDQVGVVDRCLQGRPLQPAEGGAQAGPQRGCGVCEDLHGGAWVAGPQGPEGSGLFPAPRCAWPATEAGCSFAACAKQASPKRLKVAPLSPSKATRCVSLGIWQGWAVRAVKSACGLSVRGRREPWAGSQSPSQPASSAPSSRGQRHRGVCAGRLPGWWRVPGTRHRSLEGPVPHSSEFRSWEGPPRDAAGESRDRPCPRTVLGRPSYSLALLL